MIRSATYLGAGEPGSQCGEKMLGFPLGLWSKAGEVHGGQQALVRVGGLGDQAHKSRESSLPALGHGSAYSCASSSQIITQLMSRSVSLSSAGAEVGSFGIGNSRNMSEVLAHWQMC